MGSFFERCSLSNLPIPHETPIRQLFLTQNPYLFSRQQDFRRGLRHNDYWFARTPPLKGIYHDYGRAKLEDPEMCQLVADVFSDDVIERPFGFNQYHEHAVLRGQNLDHYLNAARQGRLSVCDKKQPVDNGSPNWKEVSNLLREAGFSLQLDQDGAGYNVQPVIHNLVVVHFNAYGDTTPQLQEVCNLLSEDFDCKILYRYENSKSDACLLVGREGSFLNYDELLDFKKVEMAMTTHPSLLEDRESLPTVAVMVREDVWQAFLDLNLGKSIEEDIRRCYRLAESSRKVDYFLCELKQLSFNIPFQVSVINHLKKAARSGFSSKEALIMACVELSNVELAMSSLFRPWQVSLVGGQNSDWKLQGKLMSSLAKICRTQLKAEKDDV